MVQILVNAGIFQAGWILIVLYGNAMALAYALVSMLIYWKWFCSGSRDAFLIAATVVLGFGSDAMLGLTGILIYPHGLPVPPFWLVTLWLLFAMTLPWSLRPLTQRRMFFLALCILGGPLSYVVGERLTEVSFGWGLPQTVLILGVLWLLHGLVLLRFVHYWERAGS